MGNSVVRDFKQVSLGKGQAPNFGPGHAEGGGSSPDLIAPGAAILKKPVTVLVKRDEHRETTIFFDIKTMLPMFVSKTKTRRGSETTITKDADGKTLFLTIRPAKETKRLIYRAPEDIRKGRSSKSASGSTGNRSRSNSEDQTAAVSSSGEGSSQKDLDNSNHSGSSAHSTVFDASDVPCTAQIDVDRSGATVAAFFSLYVWKGTGPELWTVYKAVKIPRVKCGALITCIENGEVVGKSYLDEVRMQPIIQVAEGADLPSVVALTSAVLGEF